MSEVPTHCETAMPLEISDFWGDEAMRRECERLKALNAELLEALENCRDVLEDFGHIVPFLQALEQARAAIAKAKEERRRRRNESRRT